MPNYNKYSRGSILIWSVMLGVVLTSVFFFFGGRLAGSAAVEREVIEHQNAKQYLESYVGYIKSLSPSLSVADFEGLNVNLDIDDQVEGNEIEGELTQNASAITGFLEHGMSSPAYVIAEEVIIEWNRCAWGEAADLLLSPPDAPQYHTGICDAAGEVFSDIVTTIPADSLTLTALSGPLHFQITATSGNALTGNEWNLDLSIPLSFRKKITVQESFTVE